MLTSSVPVDTGGFQGAQCHRGDRLSSPSVVICRTSRRSLGYHKSSYNDEQLDGVLVKCAIAVYGMASTLSVALVLPLVLIALVLMNSTQLYTSNILLIITSYREARGGGACHLA